jgi:hypothetical protein
MLPLLFPSLFDPTSRLAATMTHYEPVHVIFTDTPINEVKQQVLYEVLDLPERREQISIRED